MDDDQETIPGDLTEGDKRMIAHGRIWIPPKGRPYWIRGARTGPELTDEEIRNHLRVEPRDVIERGPDAVPWLPHADLR